MAFKGFKIETRLYTSKDTQVNARNAILEKLAWVIDQRRSRSCLSSKLFDKIAKLYFSL